MKKPMFLRSFGRRSAACTLMFSHNRVWRPKDVKTSENETVPTGGLFPNLQKTLFSQVNAACVSRPIFFLFLNFTTYFQPAQNIVFSQVDVHVSLVPFFPIP